MRVKGTAQVSERTLNDVLCLSQSKDIAFGLRKRGKDGVLWYLKVLRPFLYYSFHSGVVGTTCHVVLGSQLLRFPFDISKLSAWGGVHLHLGIPQISQIENDLHFSLRITYVT